MRPSFAGRWAPGKAIFTALVFQKIRLATNNNLRGNDVPETPTAFALSLACPELVEGSMGSIGTVFSCAFHTTARSHFTIAAPPGQLVLR
jgi:hypothetical protein